MTKGEISTKQKAAIRALLTGASYGEAAEAAKVHQNTVTLWMADPVFQAALHQAEGEAIQAVSRSLVALADKAAGVLEGILDNPTARDSSKVRAADVVLSRLLPLREMIDLEARISELEKAVKQ